MELSVFQCQQFGKVRTAIKDDEILFIATDVCNCLDLGNSRQATARLDDDEVHVITNDTKAGKRELTAINESGLYSLILTSRKSEAKKFKKWITSEVLPSIRKHGGYLTPQVADQLKQLISDEVSRQLGVISKSRPLTPMLRSSIKEIRATLEVKNPCKEDEILSIHDFRRFIRDNFHHVSTREVYDYLIDKGYLTFDRGGHHWPTMLGISENIFILERTKSKSAKGYAIQGRKTRITHKGIEFVLAYINGGNHAN